MKILYTIIDGEVTGGNIICLKIILEALRRGCEVVVNSPTEGKFTAILREKGLKVYNIDTRRTFRLDSAIKLARIIKKEGIHLVHSHAPLAGTFLSLLGGWMAKVAVITHIHARYTLNQNPFVKKYQFLLNWISNRLFCARAIAVCEAVKNEVIRQGASTDKIIVVYNGIDLNNASHSQGSSEIRQEFGLGQKQRVVIEVGRLCKSKGQHILIRSASKVINKNPDTVFMIVGEDLEKKGGYERELKDLASSLGLRQQVIFAGYRQDIRDLLNAADLFVLPSLVAEGLPIVILEAMAAKKAVITTPIGGNPEIVLDGQNGTLIPPNDAERLAEAITYHLEHPEISKRMGEKEYERLKQNFSLSGMLNKVMDIYKEVLTKEKMAVIGLDATSLSIYGKGVSVYQYNLIKGLAKVDKKNRYYVFFNKKNILPSLPEQDNFCYVGVSVPKRIIWDQFQLPILSLKYKLDICHCLTDILPITGKGKFVLCVIEIPDYRIELADKNRHSSLYTRLSRRYNMFLFRSSLKKASVIIVSSNSTKEDLIKRYNVDAKKIRVLYLAAEECFCVNDDEKELFNTRKKYKSEIGYILHISSSDPRDNTPVVIRAYQKALGKLNVPKKLVIAGNVDAEEKELRELITELNLKDNIIFTGYLPRQELVSLYQAADLFIGPSLFEGFGLQVVEAMACGIPIITSNVTALPEIVGNAGILVAPTDTHRLASALVEILNNSRLTQMMRQNSLERAKFFLWDRTARDTLDIYNSLLGKEKPLF